jgi:cation-transporting ATPase E
MNIYKWAVLGGCSLAIVLSFIYFKDFFGITNKMSLQGILLCINFSIMTEAIFRYVSGIFNFFENLFSKIHNKLVKN